jgi:hypothetical protein
LKWFGNRRTGWKGEGNREWKRYLAKWKVATPGVGRAEMSAKEAGKAVTGFMSTTVSGRDVFKEENQERISAIAHEIASKENTNAAAAYQLAVKQEWGKVDPNVWNERAKAANSVVK